MRPFIRFHSSVFHQACFLFSDQLGKYTHLPANYFSSMEKCIIINPETILGQKVSLVVRSLYDGKFKKENQYIFYFMLIGFKNFMCACKRSYSPHSYWLCFNQIH